MPNIADSGRGNVPDPEPRSERILARLFRRSPDALREGAPVSGSDVRRCALTPCGASFVAYRSTNRFCSRACQRRAYRITQRSAPRARLAAASTLSWGAVSLPLAPLGSGASVMDELSGRAAGAVRALRAGTTRQVRALRRNVVASAASSAPGRHLLAGTDRIGAIAAPVASPVRRLLSAVRVRFGEAVGVLTGPIRRSWGRLPRRIRVPAASFAIAGSLLVLVITMALGHTWVVNDTRDRVDINVGDRVCDADGAAGQQCTLRAAIQEANANGGADLIQIQPGTYAIGIAPINENAANVGDFEILDPVTIEKVPNTLGNVIIDGGTPLPSSPLIARGLDRLFEVHPGAGDVTLRDLILQNGYSAEDGGAIQNWSLGKLTLVGVTVRDSYAVEAGGGLNHADLNDYEWTTEPPNLAIMPHGRVEIYGSTFTGNGSGGGSGAAINNVSGGTITISDRDLGGGTRVQSVITLNPGPIMPDPLEPEEFILVDPSDYPFDGSAIANQAQWGKVGTLRISNTLISLNASEGNGAGILSEGDSIVELTNVTLDRNRSGASGGGLYTEGGIVTVSGSTVVGNQAANGGGLYSGGAVSQYGLRGRFTVAGSTFSGNIAENGGGMYNQGEAQLTVTTSTFSENLSTDHGAAIASTGRSNMSLLGVTVEDNVSNGEGGGVWTHSERLQSIFDSTFTGNDAGVPVIEDGVLSDDVAGGGALYTDGGPVSVVGSTFDGNTATEEGGALSIHNLGDVEVVDSVLRNNRAFDGGGVENSATRVTFLRVLVEHNRAGGEGGGIFNTSSGEFHIIDSTIRGNSGVVGGGLANAPDNAIIMRGSLIANNTARIGFSEDGELDENAGRGGGIMSYADGASLYENVTISGNKAAVAGGGLFHDADGILRIVHATIWRNSAPYGGGIGVVESDFAPPIPPKTIESVVVKNSIVGGSVQGGNCDWYVRSEGGNLETGERHTCFLAVTESTAQSPIELGVRDRRGDPQLWALADNGGPTMTHALQWGSLAIDSSDRPCSVTDQRGVSRPAPNATEPERNKCDAGAYEFVGPPPPLDTTPPETFFEHPEDGPVQDGVETMAFRFRGTDNLTPPEELNFECRFLEIDLAEEPEIVPPWEPTPPELMWNGCSSPWSVPLPESGIFIFEVRAIDRAGNVDPTPIEEPISGVGMNPPNTVIVEAPGLPAGQQVEQSTSDPDLIPQTTSRSALFSFVAVSDFTPPQFAEYECRLDSRDPAMWLECTSPAMYSDLTTGVHVFEVRAAAGDAAIDPTPARYTWRVGPSESGGGPAFSCAEANITLTPAADGWADEVNPTEAYTLMTELEVRSGATLVDGNTIGQNARAFFRFNLGQDAPDCVLEEATLRLYASSSTGGRTLVALPLAETWRESTLTWFSQPEIVDPSWRAEYAAGDGYRDFDVTGHVQAIFDGDLPNHGWMIADKFEGDVDGGDQTFLSREYAQDWPDITLPELVLRFTVPDPGPPPARDPLPAGTTEVECGQLITASTRIGNDLIGCLGEGLAIGKANIIVDLNGHTITSGLLLEPGEEDGLTPGIRSSYPNVEIRGGTISGFGYGVLLGPNSQYTEVHGMTLARNALTGVQLFDADNGHAGPTIHDNVIDSNGETGIQLISGTEGAVVRNNYFVSNGMSIHLFDASDNHIHDNEISGLILDPALDSDAGIVLESGSRRNLLERNNVSDTGDAGIIIHQGSHDNTVIGGVLVRNGDAGVIVQDSNGIEIRGVLSQLQSDGGVVLGDSSNSSVLDNDLRFNPSGIAASNTDGLLVSGNNVSHSLQAGISLGNGLGMQIIDNTASHTGGSGISLEGAAFNSSGQPVGGALVQGNVANQNAEHGISAEVGGHTIAANQAYNNNGYGILAGEETPPALGDPQNVDGGGNQAAGNHADGVNPGLPDAIQCLGVVCTPGDAPAMTPADVEAPDTEVTATPPDETGSDTARFEFRGTDNVDPSTALTFECRLDAPEEPVIVEPPDPEPPEPGAEPPEIPEGEFWVACVSPHTYLMLEPGEHHFEVRAVDQAGNFDTTPAELTWMIMAGVEEDGSEECQLGEPVGSGCSAIGVAPETLITVAPGIPDENDPDRYTTTSQSATFGFIGSDNLTSGYNLDYECRTWYDEDHWPFTPAVAQSLADADAGDAVVEPAWGSCDSPKQYSALDYGAHLFEVRTVDVVGNADASPAWHMWWIYPPPPDLTAPDTEILTGPDSLTVLTNATFTFTGSDNQTALEELAFECNLDFSGWVDCGSPRSVSGLVPGEHILQVRAKDAAGNVDDVNGLVDAPSNPTTDPSDGVPAAYSWTVGTAPVPRTVFCGQVITQSTLVNNNLGDCLGHGLIVGASNITIDLNGRTIDGKSLGAGILNNGFDNVTIKNGTLADFDYGVMLNQGARSNIVEGVTAQLNQEAGVALGHGTFPDDPNVAPSEPVAGFQSGVDGNILRSNTLLSNARGVWLVNGAKDNVLRGSLIGATSGEAVNIVRAGPNLIEGNEIAVASKAGVQLEGATGNVIVSNTIVDVGVGVSIGATTTGTTGIESTGNRIEGNVIMESAGPALRITSSSGNQLIDNIGTEVDSYAVELYLADDNLVRGNDVSGNKGGVSLKNSSGNTIEANDASSSDSAGISLESQSHRNQLIGNISSDNQGNGIYIGDETPAGEGTLVQGNTTNANNGMGIYASKPSHVFIGNVAMDNGSWGINVGDPSGGRSNVDGGGNVAQGNAGPLGIDLKPQQCYNITCLGGASSGDLVPPSTTILSGPIQPTSQESLAVFTFTGADNASPVNFQCRLNGADWTQCTSPKTYLDLADGSTNTFDVRAIDISGNADESPATYTWSVEYGDFMATIDSHPEKVTVEVTATFAFSSNRQSGVTYRCLVVDAGAYVAGSLDTAPLCTSPVTYTGLGVGEHEFWLLAAAPEGDQTKMYSWTIGDAPVEAEVFCGQLLTQSTRLLNDLVDCPGHGLIVGADGITIDLDGHVVDGDGADAGILNNGHADVTVRNGLVSQFLTGVQLGPGTVRNVIHDLRVEGNAEAGIALSDADLLGQGNTIRNNSIVGNELGIALYTGTRHALIRDNSLGANQGEGAIYLEFASDNHVEGNQLSLSGGAGIYMIGGGDNTVIGNEIRDSGGFGIVAGEELLPSNQNLVSGNTIRGGQGGVLVGGADNEIIGNTVSGSTGPGVVVELATGTLVIGNNFGGNASGIAVDESTDTRIEGNNASGTLGSGIEVGELAQRTEIVNNMASGNGGAGIEVVGASIPGEGTLIEGNTADANGGDGIYVEGAGSRITGNAAQMNGGWGIYNVGAVDGGANTAAGNMEPEQCFGVVCTIGVVPGSPDTMIVTGPIDIDTATDGIQSNSRNASFTYTSPTEPITDLVFECRIDSTNPLAWEDCEYPAEFLNLSPGTHTFEVRAITQMGQGLADPTPASRTWTYVPLPSGVAPEVIIDVTPTDMEPTIPGFQTWLLEGVFTFHSNEPDVTFQCRVDTLAWEPCGFESATFMNQGAYEYALAETEVGEHTFQVRAIDFEGNIGTPAEFTWSLMGITVVFTDGPGFTPATGVGPDAEPATGGPTASTSAEIEFAAVFGSAGEVADVLFWCRFDSLDPAAFFPCESPFLAGPAFAAATDFPEALLPGEHTLEVFAEAEGFGAAELETAVYEWEVVDPVDTAPPNTLIERAPSAVGGTLSSTIFEFTGTDDLTPPQLLTFQCQVTEGSAAPLEADWVDCVSPFNLLTVYSYQDPQMSVGQPKTFWVRAVDAFEPEFPDPNQPPIEGNVDPSPASHPWTPESDALGPITAISGGPADGATVGAEIAPYTFFATDNATPTAMLDLECAAFLTVEGIGSAAWADCESPHDLSGLAPGAYTFAVRAVDLALQAGAPATRTLTVASAPVVTFTDGPAGRIDPQSGLPDGASATENAIFEFQADQPGATFECSFDGAAFVACAQGTNPPTAAAWVVTTGNHEFAVRATNAQGFVGDETVYEWYVELGPDTLAPDAEILAAPPLTTLLQTATFSFRGSDNRTPAADLSFECALDSTTAWNTCTSPVGFSDLARGEHTLRVRAIDAAGNIGVADAYTWTVAPPPITAILTGPGVEVEASTSRTATFTFSADVAGVTFHCWLDGAFNPAAAGFPTEPAPCDSGVSYADLGLGTHLFAVRAVDTHGHVGPWEDVEFTVLPSEARITTAPVDGTSTTATFRFTSEPFDANAIFYCSLDERPFALCTDAPVDGSPGVYEKTYTNLWPGPHTFRVQTLYLGVLDWMGEPFEHEPVPAAHAWTVTDLTDPETEIVFGPAATTLSTSAYLMVSTDDPTATVACTLTGPTAGQSVPVGCEPGIVIELTGLLPGTYELSAVASDPSGNVDATPATYAWTIGTPSGPPNTPAGPNQTVTIDNVSITFASVDTAGITTVDRLAGGPSLPDGFGGASSHIYDISTTATYTEPVTVCVTYDPTDFGGITSLRLLHFDGELWLDITTLHDPFSATPRICSNVVEGFSLFAIAVASSGMAPETSILSGPDGPLNADGLPTSTSGSATFEFWTDQPDAITQCSIDGDPFFYCESPLTIGPLEAGEQEFMVQAINSFGWMDLTPAVYEWEILGPDVTAPTTLITGGPPDGSSTPNFISIFTFSGADDFTPATELEFECTLDGEAIGGCDPLGEEIEVTAAGEHTLTVQAIDAAGNIDSVGVTRTWTVIDMTAPDTEILTGPEEETTETSATFTFEGFELLDGTPVTQFECALDTQDFGPCPGAVSGEATYTGLGGGAHVFHVRAVDTDGNRDFSPAFYEWLIIGPPDTTAPETSIELHPDQANSGPSVIFAFASDEPVETFECSMGMAPAPTAPTTWEECGAVLFLENLAGGEHWLWVRAIDPAGNVDATPAGADLGSGPDTAPFTWVTTGEPDTFITSGPSDPSGDYSAEFVFGSGQAGATFQCSVNGSPWVPCTSSAAEPFIVGPVLPGEGGEPAEHEFEVRAVNQYLTAEGAQVMDETPEVYAWTVQDISAPVTVFLGAAAIGPDQFMEPGLRFTFRGDDDLGSSVELEFECAVTNTTETSIEVWESCGEPFTGDAFYHDVFFADLAPGDYTFQVRATDAIGNHDLSPEPASAYEFGVEAEPETTITSVTPGGAAGFDPATSPELETTATSITFELSGTGVSFLCSLDAIEFEPCTSPVEYSAIPFGTHLFRVIAVAQLGTLDASAAEFEWITGTDVAPDVAITDAPPAAGSTSPSATFEFGSTDATATFSCSLDGAAFTPCTSPMTSTGLLAGAQNPHVFVVEASTAHLLPSVTRNLATHSWTISDATAPTTTLLDTPSSPSANEVTLTFTGSDNGTLPVDLAFECSLSGPGLDPAFEPCTSPVTYDALAGGSYTFAARATDETGLTGAAATHAWDVIAPPATSITNTTPSGTVADGGLSASATGELTFVDQPGSTYECRLDPVDETTPAFAPCSSPVAYDLANGTHVFEVRARTLPLGGQTMLESPAASHEWEIQASDTTDPETTILLGPAATTANTTATFIFGGSDNLTAAADLVFECSLFDGVATTPFVECASGDLYTALAVGTYTLEVRAIDSAVPANVDLTPDSHTWTVVTPAAANTDPDTLTVSVGGATITFSTVTLAGTTSVSQLVVDGPIALPSGYVPTGAIVYDVSTTATFAGDVTVCLPAGTLGDAHLLHFDGSEWVDVTLEVVGSQVCGVVSSLSPFAAVEVSSAIAPETTIVQAPDASTIQSTSDGANVQFQFTSSLALSDFECSLDGAAWSSCDTPYTFNALFGAHELRVRAVSETGVVDSTPAVHTWTVYARPTVTITASPEDLDIVEPGIQTDSTSAVFSFASGHADATFRCRLSGETIGAWEACSSGWTYTDLVLDTEYTFEVEAVSAAGNASFVPATFEWEVLDLSAPTVTITGGPSGSVDQTDAQFTFTSSEPATFECSTDGAPFGTCASGTTYTGFGLGAHTFTVRATDLSESENASAEVTRTWTVADLTDPSVAINLKPASTTSSTSASFTFAATDNWPGAIGLRCRLDGAAFAACTSPVSYSSLSATAHTFEVEATDAAGNVASATWTWTVEDVVAPEAEITDVTAGSITFTFTGSDDHTASGNLDFECQIDAGAWGACASPKTYSSTELAAMTPGDHTFRVRAIDEAGNTGAADSHVFTVADTTAPNTQLTGQPTNNTTNTDASFTFTGSDDGTASGSLTFECQLDGGAWTACTSPRAYSALAVGSHTFSVRATDAAGNTDASPASFSWTIQAPADTTAPDTTLTAQPPAVTTETNASFSFTATETGSTFQCQIDGGAWAACTSPRAYSALAVGSHTFAVRATDAAGNTDATPAAFTWTIQGQTVTCPAPVTLTANADAWIDSGSTSSNKGGDSILKVMSKSGGNLRALVRFALPSLPDGCSIDTAVLRVYAKSAAGGRTLQALQLSGTWTEGGVTWANQPTTTGTAATTTSGTGYREWNVASMVQAMITGGNNGFLIRDAVENQDAEQQFHAREESTNRPQLVITFTGGTPPPPPPGGSDTTAPQTTITGTPGSATSSTSATFTFNGTDNTTPGGSLLFECQLDGAAWAACTSPRAYTGLSVGTHTFGVRARDGANNVDASPAVHTWTIDQTAPDTAIVSGPSATTTTTSATFTFTSSETGSSFQCSLDSTTAYTACASPHTYSNVAVGAHTFRVRAVDAAGNADGSPAAYPWTVQSGGGSTNCGSAQTVAANADSWIEQSSSSSNKGTDSILKVMSKSGNSNLRALVRFALPVIPAGCVLDTATLRLYAGSAASGRTLQAIRLNATWNETSVTWSNQPATTGSAVTTTSGTGYRQWAVTGIVQAMYSSGSAHGFLIRDASENQDAEQQFYSREKGEQPPQLVITFKAATGGAVGGPIGTGGPLWQAVRLAPAPVDPIVLVATQVTTLAALAVLAAVLISPRVARRPPGPPLGA